MISIRQTINSDVDTLHEIQKNAFLPIYEKYHDNGNPCLRGPEDISRRLTTPFFKCFTILDDDKIVGGVIYKCQGQTPFVAQLGENEFYLTRIFIKPDCQSHGMGTKAILLCEKEFVNATKFYVDFPKELEKNKRCYEKAGFINTGKELEIEAGLVLVNYEKEL